MKKINKNSIASMLVLSALTLGISHSALAAGPASVNLLSAGSFIILAKTGISTTGTTAIAGDIGVSPATATAITGFGLTLSAGSSYATSPLVTGKVYAPTYASPTPVTMTNAISDMQSAYTDAQGRTDPTATELGAGNIGGLTIAPGLYKWGTGVTIPSNVTLSGGENDVWIFQIAQTLTVSSGAHVILSGGAQAAHIFWVVAGQTTIGTTAIFNGNILDQTAIVMNTGATLHGRALAQTAVTLDSNSVTFPNFETVVVTPPPPVPPPTPTPAPAMCEYPAPPQSCSYVNGSSYNTTTHCGMILSCPTGVTPVQNNPPVYSNPIVGASNVSSVLIFSKLVRTIAVNLGQGSRDPNVKILQQFLISQNKGSAAVALSDATATGYFGVLTRAALAEFQASVGISPALGNFGPITRAYVSANY